MDYTEFLNRKTHIKNEHGFKPLFIHDDLFDFQKHLVEWACLKGRSAIFADCGLGKTFMQLVWAQNIVQKTNKPVLILTPLAVGRQTVAEGARFGIECYQSRDGKWPRDKKNIVTNYEKLHLFDPQDFCGCVCDESSILKHFTGATQMQVTRFVCKMPYRLLCTATAAPNDYIELGTSSEALGVMGFVDMLNRFFKKVEKTQSRKDEHRFGVYRFRGHAEKDFWRWVCSWARAMRRPSDLGFSDDGFVLPELIVRDHIVTARIKADGMLFDLPATDLREQRDELNRTISDRCDLAASLVSGHKLPFIVWCHLNKEGEYLKREIKDAVEIKGSDSDEKKEEAFYGFAQGDIRGIITKPKIGGFGMNWQHCAHQVYFPSHSYEQYYQCIRRSWRYGQKKNVTIDRVSTEGQSIVLANLNRKTSAADTMFENLVAYMGNELEITGRKKETETERIPSWLSESKC